MELINVQLPHKEFQVSDYNYDYRGILIAIKNNNPIGIILVDENMFYLVRNNVISNYFESHNSIKEIIDEYGITELKLIKFSN